MIPLPIAVIASSLTPKWRFLPAGFSAEKSPASFMAVLLDGARSAEPPIMFGMMSFKMLIILPERERVASALSFVSQSASFSISAFASGAVWYCSQSFSISGYSSQYAANIAFHAASTSAFSSARRE